MTDTVRAHPLVLATAGAGALAALAGGYWDDAWHTERGRDSFFIAPHVAIYAGIAVAGVALSAWALLVAVRGGGFAAVRRHPPVALALVSVVVTLASGPIDNAWHAAFGRDAVIWSPPHMLGIAGTVGLAAAVLAELAARWSPWARRLVPVAGALVLAAAGFAVAEYDTDVPQFDAAFYLPALAVAAGFALLLVRAGSGGRWAATAAAAVHLALIAGVGGFLWLVDFPPPALPLLVLPAAVVDVAAARRWSAPRAAAAFTLALHVAYVPGRNWVGDGVRFDLADVAAGGALTFAATLALFALASRTGERPTRATWRRTSDVPVSVGAAVVLLVVLPAVALAHDPGQGDEVGTVALRVTAVGERVSLTADLSAGPCRVVDATGSVAARRAGRTLRAPLARDGCRFTGSVAGAGRGRWFVYAELPRGGRTVESWLPITVGDGRTTVTDPARYAYVPPKRSSSGAKIAAGIALYAAVFALLATAFSLAARSRPAAARAKMA